MKRLLSYLNLRLDKKVQVTSKYMTSQTVQQIIRKHILSNISSKDSQTMNFNKSIEYSKRNIF